MGDITQKTNFRVATFILMIALLLPSAVKFSHIFSHNQHEICNGENQTHLHKSDIDCNFYKFKLNTNFYSLFEYFEMPFKVSYFKIDRALYFFLNNHRPLSFSLRGPPALV
jgi:hypothetical protein